MANIKIPMAVKASGMPQVLAFTKRGTAAKRDNSIPI
jgi:hypothetical protein